MARINPFQFALMGFAKGAFEFALSDELENRRLRAEQQKLDRLEVIRREQEQRDNAEWERRFALEKENAQIRDEVNFRQQLELTRAGQQFTAGENAKSRSHDSAMLDERQAFDLEMDERRAAREKERQEMGTPDGLYGSDGKFYPQGTPLPPGVTPTVGFGATNLGTRGLAGGASYVSPRAGARSGIPGVPGPVPAKRGSSQDDPLDVASVQEAQKQAPGTWIRLPNGKVGQR